MLRGQLLQLALEALLVLAALVFAPPEPIARGWFHASLAACVLHHLWVSVAWRLELHRSWVSRTFGHPRGFHLFQAGFTTLAIARVGAVWGLAWLDAGTLALPRQVAFALAGLCLALAVWLLASVHRHFGMDRAMGLDHWEPERFRGLPLVRRGLHRLTPNAMYVFGPTIVLAPAVGFGSRAGLAASVFNALCLWTHYVCTERPDMARIHGQAPCPGRSPGSP